MPGNLATCVAERKPYLTYRVTALILPVFWFGSRAHGEASPGRRRLRQGRIPSHQEQLQFVRFHDFRRILGRGPITKMPGRKALLAHPKTLLIIGQYLYGRPSFADEHEHLSLRLHPCSGSCSGSLFTCMFIASFL